MGQTNKWARWTKTENQYSNFWPKTMTWQIWHFWRMCIVVLGLLLSFTFISKSNITFQKRGYLTDLKKILLIIYIFLSLKYFKHHKNIDSCWNKCQPVLVIEFGRSKGMVFFCGRQAQGKIMFIVFTCFGRLVGAVLGSRWNARRVHFGARCFSFILFFFGLVTSWV